MHKTVLIECLGCCLALGIPESVSGKTYPQKGPQEYFELGKKSLKTDPAKARQYFSKAASKYARAFQNPEMRQKREFFANWGKAHFLAEEIPEAILAFRRGLSLDVADSDLRSALTFARQQVEYPPAAVRPPDPWDNLAHQSRAGWFWKVALVFYALTFVALTYWLLARHWSGLIGVLLLAGCAALATFNWTAADRQAVWEGAHPLVVVREDKLPFRTGNGPSYPASDSLPVLRRGMEGCRTLERGGWLQVRFPGDALGWVPRDAVLVDE